VSEGVDAAIASQIRNIESAYGQPLAHWFAVIDQSGLSKHNEVVSMLKTQHGMAHGAAHRVSLLARARSEQASGSGSVSDAVSTMYSGPKAALRPWHDELMNAVLALGEVEIAPKKGYVSLRRRKQFAMLQPSAAGRIDVGLIMPPGTSTTGRLESAAKFNALFTHRVRITTAGDIDAQLLGWLRAAYEAAL
jgi:hypothetical protein